MGGLVAHTSGTSRPNLSAASKNNNDGVGQNERSCIATGQAAVNGHLLQLMGQLRADVECSFRRYEKATLRLLDGDAADCAATPSCSDSFSNGRAHITKGGGRGLLEAWPDVIEEQFSCSAALPNSVHSKPSNTSGTAKSASPKRAPSSGDGNQSRGSIARSAWMDRLNCATRDGLKSNEQQLIRELAMQKSSQGMWERLSQLKVNAKPLVSKDSRLHRIVQNARYSGLRGAVVALDSALILGELEYNSRHVSYGQDASDNVCYLLISGLLCLFLWCDMVFTNVSEFPRLDFVNGRTGYRFLNVIGLIQHTLSLLGAALFPHSRFSSEFRVVVSMFSFLRIFRAVVVLPELGGKQLHQKLGELHIMIRALTGALKPLLWCTLMCIITLVIFGVFFTEVAVTYLVKDGVGDEEALIHDWGALSKSIITLYLSMLGGQNWGDFWETLDPLKGKVVFVLFICFSYIALLNTVTAVFIKCAFMRFEHDREFVIQQELDDKRGYLLSVRQIFSELDVDDSGIIIYEELVEHLKDPRVSAYFSKLGVDTNEVEKLFVLLDEDGSGSIDREEFACGCLRLKGEAKSLDLKFLHKEVKLAIECLKEIDQGLRAQFAMLQAPMDEEAQNLRFGIIHRELRLLAEQLQEMGTEMEQRMGRLEAAQSLMEHTASQTLSSSHRFHAGDQARGDAET